VSHFRGELRRTAPLATIALVFASWATPALADPPEVRARLTYEVLPGAEACPQERTVREQVGLRLGYDPFHEDGDGHVTVRLSPRPGGLHAAITTEQPGEPAASRDLDSEGASCDELVRSLVLAVSLAIDPLSLTRAPRVPPAPGPAPAPAPPPATAPQPRKRPWNIELAGGLRGGYALLPGGGSIGPLVDLRVGKQGWALLAEVGADLPTGHVSKPTGSETVSGTLLRGGLGACLLPAWFMACAQIDAGEVQGTGTGQGATTGSSFYLDAEAAAGLNMPLSSSLRLQIVANLVVPITRTSLGFQIGKTKEVDTLWTSSALAGLLSAGVAYRF